MKVDLSEYNSRGIQYMRQVSEELIIETYGNWESLFVKCKFYLPESDKWIPALYRIGIRPIKLT